MDKQKLNLNGDNTEVVILGKHPSLWGPQLWPASLGALQTPSVKVINLVFLLDDLLSMKPQVFKVTAMCFAVLKRLRTVIWMIPVSAQRTVISALVLPRLDYCNMLYLGIDKPSIRRLQVVQNAAARLLSRIPKFASVSCLLHKLHWLTIPKRITCLPQGL